MSDFLKQLAPYTGQILHLTTMHLLLVLTATAFAFLIAFPAGVWATRRQGNRYAAALMSVANVFQTVPSLAVIGMSSALFTLIGTGVGWLPALTALSLYSLLPILGNTIVGLSTVPSSVRHTGLAAGMTHRQLLRQVELPLATPLILNGLHTAFVINVGTAALAASIGAECLGTLIFQGISTGNIPLLMAGAIPTAVLAVLIDIVFRFAERKLRVYSHFS